MYAGVGLDLQSSPLLLLILAVLDFLGYISSQMAPIVEISSHGAKPAVFGYQSSGVVDHRRMTV